MKSVYLRSFSGVIWKLLTDPYFNRLGLEIRSEQELDHFYIMIDLEALADKEVRLSGVADWWSRLVGVFGNSLGILQYKDQNNPGPGTFILYDYSEEEIVVEQNDFLLSAFDRYLVRGSETDGQAELEMDLSEYYEIIGSPLDLIFPVLYEDGSEDFQWVSSYLKQELNVDISLGAEYLEYGNYIFVSYYLPGRKNYSRHFIAIQDGEIDYKILMDERTKGLSTESFVLMGNQLIFVENRNTIHVYEL